MDTKRLLKEYLVTEVMVSDTIADDDNLFELGVIDSMGILRLAGFIEEEFGIEVSSDEFVPEHFQSICAMADFVESKR